MTIVTEEYAVLKITETFDIILARRHARRMAEKIGFKIVDQTRIVTAVSEIARNALVHGGGGKIIFRNLNSNKGIEIVVVDQGPGISNIYEALNDGYSTINGLGLGLGGAKRLMDEFYIESEIGEGTKVTMRKWLTIGGRLG